MTTYFCDGLKEVTLLNGVVRLEFHRLQGRRLAGAGSELETVTVLRVALPPQGLAQACDILGQVHERLIREGVLQKPADDAPPAGEGARLRSPNFS